MENRKAEEIKFYDDEALEFGNEMKESGSRGGFDPFLLGSYKFLKRLAENNFRNKKVLDYGCGMGIHLVWLSKIAESVVGIDLSRNSLEKAKKTVKDLKNTEVLLMDCENTKFFDNTFDAVFDGGTFSSLDLDAVLSELRRILKPGGVVVGIETLGHNPMTNFKRYINKIRGRRTGWAADHIFKVSDLEKVKMHFTGIDAYFFHLASWLAFPFLKYPFGMVLLKFLEKIDEILISFFPFLRKYSFKIVFVFSGPRK